MTETLSKKQAETTVLFYTKAGCHLCEDARDMLETLAETVSYELTEVDIRSDMAVFETYRYRIPVIYVRQGSRERVVEGRIAYADLENAFLAD